MTIFLTIFFLGIPGLFVLSAVCLSSMKDKEARRHFRSQSDIAA